MTFDPDPDQAQVLDHDAGPLLVTGPPGSGKTALLRERFARLVEAGADPERVALLVLNRRAARDAREHLIRRLARSVPDLPVLTAHGLAFRVVGGRFGELGYQEPPEVLSAPEQYAVVRDLLEGEDRADWPSFGHLLANGGFARQLADFVLRAQERLLAPDDLDALVDRSGRGDYAEVAGFYRRYLDAMADRTDFGGLLFQAASVLGRGVPEEFRFDHLLVDDYQDVTPAGEAVVRALAREAKSVVVAADPAGHVFSYQGGTLEPLGRVEETLPGIARVALERSHRLDARRLAPLERAEAPAPPAEPAGIEARLFVHPGEEVEAVAHELLRARVDADVAWDRMAVIVRRYGPYLTALRHALARHGIPFLVVAEEAAVATEPANRPVIDLLAYVFRPDRRDELIESVLTSPVGGIDPHGLRQLRREARRREMTLTELVDSGEAVPAPVAEPVERFRRVVRELPGEARQPDAAFFWLWRELPWFGELVASDDRHRDLDALAALGDVLARFVERRPGASVEDYLATLEAAEFGPDPWRPPEERHPDAVRVVSAHRAHGLEFDVALVVGALEGEFPSLGHAFPLLDLERLEGGVTAAERTAARLAEERALFRLAVSRSRERTVLFASHSASTRNPRTPTRFAERLGLRWQPPPDGEVHTHAASLRSMEASLRLALADRAAPAPDRLAAAAALAAVGARPAEWWGGREWTDPGAPLHPGELRTSYSRLSTLENCALQYLYAVELGLDPEQTHHMWLGGVVHDLIDRVHKGELPRDRDALVAELDRVWQPDRFPNRAVERQRRRDSETMLANWLRGEGNEPLVSEERFRFPIDGALIRGVIDAVFRTEDGRLRLIDYKTGRDAPSKEEAEEDLQLATYYLALTRAEELRALGRPRFLELHFLVNSRRKEAYQQVRVAPEGIEGYGERAEARIRELLETVRAERFGPNPEADCRFCSFKTICPVWPQGAEVTA